MFLGCAWAGFAVSACGGRYPRIRTLRGGPCQRSSNSGTLKFANHKSLCTPPQLDYFFAYLLSGTRHGDHTDTLAGERHILSWRGGPFLTKDLRRGCQMFIVRRDHVSGRRLFAPNRLAKKFLATRLQFQK